MSRGAERAARSMMRSRTALHPISLGLTWTFLVCIWSGLSQKPTGPIERDLNDGERFLKSRLESGGAGARKRLGERCEASYLGRDVRAGVNLCVCHCLSEENKGRLN